MSDDHDAPECSNCGKATCPDADLWEFTEPRECEFTSMYEAFRATKDCDYGCGRDYSMQAVRLWLAPEMERILTARLAAQAAEHEREAEHWKSRRDAAVEQCRHLHQDGKTREQWHLDNCGAMRALADLRGRLASIAAKFRAERACGEDCRAAEVAAALLASEPQP